MGKPSARGCRVSRTFAIADHVEIGRELVTDLGGQTDLIFDELHPWRYDGRGLWRRIDRAVESCIVQGYSGTPTLPNGKPLRVKAADVSGAIKLAHDQIAKPGFFENAPRGIVFSNGFLRVTAENGAVLETHDRKHAARAGYPFSFERGACPRLFLGFLDSLFRDDEDRCEKTSYVQEFFGACVLGLAPIYQRCTIATGGGENGKSRLADVAIECMPPGTTSAIAPQEWGNEYRRAMLVGKHLNAVGELPEREILASESFKAIVAGDPIVARIIRESPVMYRPIAGHYFAANALPGTPDQTEGFWRRFVVLTFNRSFKNDPTRDPHIATRILAAERPAIASWFIDGAVRLLRSREYTIPPSHHAALAAWRKGANQIALFVDDETKADLEPPGVPASDLYSAYLRWAERNRHRPMASNTFGVRMKLLGLEPRKTENGWRYPLAFLTALDRAEADKPAKLMTGSSSCN
jgi:P4 family phage/plasmid primase-like protien